MINLATLTHLPDGNVRMDLTEEATYTPKVEYQLRVLSTIMRFWVDNGVVVEVSAMNTNDHSDLSEFASGWIGTSIADLESIWGMKKQPTMISDIDRMVADTERSTARTSSWANSLSMKWDTIGTPLGMAILPCSLTSATPTTSRTAMTAVWKPYPQVRPATSGGMQTDGVAALLRN